jgi:ATP-dependent Clp protease ATP-binding subunit ClpC
MFENYTEAARKVVFFAKYEASQLGSTSIETEHLLLGILRTDGLLALRLLKAPEKIESIREHIEKHCSHGEKLSSYVDLPLSRECKRALAYSAEEAERLNQKNVAAEHLLLGLLRDEQCVASKILVKAGLTASQLRQEAIHSSPAVALPPAAPLPEGLRDLTEMARNEALSPLIGRESELDRIIQILSRRTKSSPVLIGEAGVGKNAMVHGLAQRIVEGFVPASLSDRRILAIDASYLLPSEQAETLSEITTRPNTILYVRGLFDLASRGEGWGVLEGMHVLEPYLANGTLQCIATGTPLGFRQTMEKAESLASNFEVVAVLPPTEEEAIQILSSVKEQYEKFHGVEITKEVLEAAISASRWFLRHRHLPDRAIDLIDDAGARVRLRCDMSKSHELVQIERRIRQIAKRMENAIANHDFADARRYSEEERNERQNLRRLSDELEQHPQSRIVTPEDIVEAVAGRAGVPASVVKSVQAKEVNQLEIIAKRLTAQIPTGGREWMEGLATYLAGCSTAEAEKLAQLIRSSKASLDSQ